MGHFPEEKFVKTPLGAADQIWATSDTHIGLSGTFYVHRVDYRVRIDMRFRDGEWQLGEEDTHTSRWNAILISRDWDYARGRRLDPSPAARKKILDTLVPWLIAFAQNEGAQMIKEAGDQKREAEANAIWENNAIQFPRLLAEIIGNGLSETQWDDLLASMDLESDQLNNLFDRAQAEWERIKAESMVKV